MFSSRVPPHLESNALARAIDRARAAGRPPIDLTLTNPTQAGFRCPPGLLRALGSPMGIAYAPRPFGLDSARDAVAGDYARRGLHVPAERIVLTSSTSEAYSLLFKLLCEPDGDAVLFPAPSYPLFDHLTSLDGVRARPYALEYHGRWSVDLSSVDGAWHARTRALLAVSPNNPTGSVLTAEELAALDERCAGRDAALILDEVFADYPLGPDTPPILNLAAGSPPRALTFRLGGLSKSAALPQVKLGWIAVEGPAAMAGAALDRLELICDTYLSVSTPVQLAAAELIAGGAAARHQIQDRVKANYLRLIAAVSADPSVTVLNAEAGWSAVLRVPARGTEEALVLHLLDAHGVLVHPGYFFDFPHEAYIVVSLLPPSDTFAEGVRRVLEHVHA